MYSLLLHGNSFNVGFLLSGNWIFNRLLIMAFCLRGLESERVELNESALLANPVNPLCQFVSSPVTQYSMCLTGATMSLMYSAYSTQSRTLR